MKNKNKQKGITLIALIITIIILLILAGISIKALTNTGLFGKANEAKIRTEISQLEEEANLIYTSKLMDNYLSDVSMSDIVSQLQAEGYEIYSVSSDGSAITGITLDNSSISILKDGTATINVTYEGSSDSVQYYAVIDGKYYKMSLTDSGVKVETTASEVDATPSTETLTATSSDESYVTIESIENNVITLKGGSSVGTSTITVKYGSYEKNCTVSVVIKPTENSEPNSKTSFSTEYGRIDVIWLDGTSNTVATTPNAPVLTSNGESMKPVVWDSDNNIVETTSSDSNWYSYTEGTGTADNTSSKWANAKTANDSYFVWIPRYAYRITYYESATSTTPTGYYDGYGMWNATDGTVKYALDDGVETVDYNEEKYIVHPAFETNLDLGGWSSDLSGFWFAKFEMSGTGTTLASTYGTVSTRSQTIGTQYTSARQATFGYNGTIDSDDGNTSFMNSHMVKNSEWGAVAYLTHSQYGRNGKEITINSNSSHHTGGGSGTAYIDNVAQSTTGNVYGIYDMSGGDWDRVAVFNSSDSNGYLSTYGWTTATGLTVDSNSTKYATKYINPSSSSYGATIQYVYGKIGDSTKEVYKGSGINGGWFSDFSCVTCSDGPFFMRGFNFEGSSSAGVFNGSSDTGNDNGAKTFRVALAY